MASVRESPANTRTRRESVAWLSNWQPFADDVCQITEILLSLKAYDTGLGNPIHLLRATNDPGCFQYYVTKFLESLYVDHDDLVASAWDCAVVHIGQGLPILGSFRSGFYKNLDVSITRLSSVILFLLENGADIHRRSGYNHSKARFSSRERRLQSVHFDGLPALTSRWLCWPGEPAFEVLREFQDIGIHYGLIARPWRVWHSYPVLLTQDGVKAWMRFAGGASWRYFPFCLRYLDLYDSR